MKNISENPVWTTTNGQAVPYGKVVLKKGQPVYMGGTISKKMNRCVVFPEPLDKAERGFGVDKDYQGE